MRAIKKTPSLRVKLLAPLVYGAVLLAAYMPPTWAGSPRHPLDPLSMKEHWTVYEVMKESGRIDEESRFVRVRLHEPPKSEVLQWNPGSAFRREAFAVIKQGPRTFEAIVDLLKRKVTSWSEIEGVQPHWLNEEIEAIERIVKKNPQWQAAMRKRGITDFHPVMAGPISWAYSGTPGEEARRLVKVASFDRRGVTNFWGRPIEGLIVVVDLGSQEVVEVIDSGVVPVPNGLVDHDPESVGELRRVPTPISMAQPQGPSFRVNGHDVSWQKWSFHFRVDPRVGLVISNVGYADGEKLRSILYEGSLSEIFVPYMDPAEGWRSRAYLDAAENPDGLAVPLEPGLDCPGNAVFFDTVVADEHGIPKRVARAACLFERYDGSIAWRHRDFLSNQTESRRSRELVLRMITTLGNYDYVFDWAFRQDGTIKVAVGSTGVDQVKGVTSRRAAEAKRDPATKYGRFVAEHTLAVNHDHFFCLRLDLDVDGPENSFLREELKRVQLPKNSPRRIVWIVDPKVARSEKEAKLRINLERPALWRVINSNVLGPVGYPVSYQIKPKGNALSLLRARDYPQRRGGFTNHHLWVTPYREEERYAAGFYPVENKADGLPEWTSANRPIENTDIVVWYTLGFHHVVRAEDWPVMPTNWHEFELRPFDFFERNPALDLPKEP